MNYGPTEDESVPTVIVGVANRADFEWQRWTYEQIVNIIGHVASLDVIYFRSTFTLLGTKSRPPIMIDPKDCVGPVTIGTSIGVQGRTGTLGGFLKVKYAGQVYTMALTCHHVIRSKTISEGKGQSCLGNSFLFSTFSRNFLVNLRTNYAPDEDANGLCADLTRKSIRIHAPSDLDFEETVKYSQNAVHELQELIQGADIDSNDTERYRRPGLKTLVEEWGQTAREPDLRRATSNYEDLQNKIAELKSFNRGFGSVFASSGLTRYYGPAKQGEMKSWGLAIDWALIMVDSDRVGDNYVPPPGTLGTIGNFLISDTRGDPPQPREKLAKRGRNGYSKGHVSEFSTTINFESESTKFYGAFVVVGEPESAVFLQQGDSGSWGIDKWNQLSVIGFAGEQDGRASYVIPVSWIYDDIFARTGAEFVDPPIESWRQGN